MEDNKQGKNKEIRTEEISLGDIFIVEKTFGTQTSFLLIEDSEGYALADLEEGELFPDKNRWGGDVADYLNSFSRVKHYRGKDFKLVVEKKVSLG